MFLEILRNLQENFIKKETLAQVFSCEFYEIFKNTFFTENLRTTASDSVSSCFSCQQVLKFSMVLFVLVNTCFNVFFERQFRIITSTNCHLEVFCKKSVHKNFENSQESTCARVSSFLFFLLDFFSIEFKE